MNLMWIHMEIGLRVCGLSGWPRGIANHLDPPLLNRIGSYWVFWRCHFRGNVVKQSLFVCNTAAGEEILPSHVTGKPANISGNTLNIIEQIPTHDTWLQNGWRLLTQQANHHCPGEPTFGYNLENICNSDLTCFGVLQLNLNHCWPGFHAICKKVPTSAAVYAIAWPNHAWPNRKFLYLTFQWGLVCKICTTSSAANKIQKLQETKIQICTTYIIKGSLKESNFRLDWNLPASLAASMFYSTDARHERFWRVGSARHAVLFGFVASKARKASPEKREVARRIGCRRQNLHHARARTIWKSKSLKTGMPGHFLKSSFAKIAPRCGARPMSKSKSLKHYALRTFWTRKACFAWQAQGFRRCKIRGRRRSSWEGCKNVGRRGGFEEGPKRCFSRSRRKDFVLCDVDVWSLRRWIRGKVENFMLRKCYFAGIISRGSHRSSYARLNFFIASAKLLKPPFSNR